MRKILSVFFLIIILAYLAYSHGFLKDSEEERDFDLNGYIRSLGYAGKRPLSNSGEIKSAYGEASLKFRARKSGFGDAFAEIRFREGYEFKSEITEFNLREAYVNIYAGKFDFRIGHQIVAWGRADGINPTDNITPKNMLIRSPEEDDRREGNFLIRSFYNLLPLRLELVWIPSYRASVVPTELISFPKGISLSKPQYPEATFANSAFGLRANFEFSWIDGSFSYFNGHNPFPGIASGTPIFTPQGLSLEIFLKSYRMHVFGLDFQTTIQKTYGLRGEFACRIPHGDHKTEIHIPNPEIQLVLGIEKEFPQDLSLIAQYVGKYVFKFEELRRPAELFLLPVYEIESKNRMISSQLHRHSHSLFFRVGKALAHETMKIEFVSLFNVTSKEAMMRPEFTCEITDDLNFTTGIEVFSGPDETLFGTIDSTLNSIFFQLKVHF